MASLDLEATYRSHGHVVLRRARAILGNEDDAREVLQEVFMSLVTNPKQYKARSSITTFLYRVTTNKCLNNLRNRTRRGKLLAQDAAGRSEGAEPTAQASLEAAEVLRRLPERLARVAIYYYVDEMTHEEMSKLLECSRRQVGNLVSKLELALSRQKRAA